MNITRAILSTLIIWAALAYFSTRREPIPIGDATVYWEFACGVELEEFKGYFPYAKETGIFPNKDGWFFYFYREHHGRHVFKLKKESLQNTIPELFNLLDNKITSTIQQPTKYDDLESKNKRRVNCQKIREAVKADKNKFLAEINTASKNQSYEFQLDSFNRQWERGKLYWVSILFEAIILPLWWLFSFHPGAFGNWNKKRSVRLAFSPLLLFIPYYLGYSTYLFSFGPSGGVLYPLFALILSLPFIWIPFNAFDIAILSQVPQPLISISQVPFSPSAVSFHGGISPTSLLVYITLVFTVSYVVRAGKTRPSL